MAFLTHKDLLVGIDKTGEGIADEVKICPLARVAIVQPLGESPNRPYP